jgi:hypothetical protein
MALPDQMMSGLPGCFVVIGHNGICEQPDRWSVDEHQRRTLLPLGLQVALILGDRVPGSIRHPTTGEGIDHDPLAIWVVIGTGGKLPCHGCTPARQLG